jgi:hypothetical protein
MLSGGRLAKITIAYEPSVEPHEAMVYETGFFPISPTTFDDLSNPSK